MRGQLLRSLLPGNAILTPQLRAHLSLTKTHYRLPQLTRSLSGSQARSFRLFTYNQRDKAPPTVTTDLEQRKSDDHKSSLDDSIAQEKEKQTRAPWHRDGSDLPPVARRRSAGAMTKGTSVLPRSKFVCYN